MRYPGSIFGHSLLVLSVTLTTVTASAQTSVPNRSEVGTWKQIPAQGASADGPPATLTILEDRPDMLTWRVDATDANNQAVSFSWSGPKDGTLHPMRSADGQEIGRQSAHMEGNALVRHAELADGSSFDARSTLSPDGDTITDEIVAKRSDGSVSKLTYIYRRVK